MADHEHGTENRREFIGAEHHQGPFCKRWSQFCCTGVGTMGIVSAERDQRITRMRVPYLFTVFTWTVPGQPIPAPRLTQASAHHAHIPKATTPLKTGYGRPSSTPTVPRPYWPRIVWPMAGPLDLPKGAATR